jgi:hypothetical protein
VRPRILFALAVAGLFARCGCTSKASEPTIQPEPIQTESRNPRATFKGGTVLRNDLAQALDLSVDDVCNEFGLYSCTERIHRISLLGVDAYENQIFTPSPTTSPPSTLAVERTALSACNRRATLDTSNPADAAIFRNLDTAEGRTQSIQTLYERTFARTPTKAERDAFAGLYEELQQTGSSGPLDWAQAACFAVTTSREFLFF